MVVKRFFALSEFAGYLSVDKHRLDASEKYREEAFYKIFPPTVHRGPKQSPTLRWIYNRCCDGRGVVTPRDVIDLLSRAKQKQCDECVANIEGTSNCIVGTSALQYGLSELSKTKRRNYLEAEFPHWWTSIEKFIGGKSEYDEGSLRKLFSKEWASIADDLSSIGLLQKIKRRGELIYSIPPLYRQGLEVTQLRGKQRINTDKKWGA